MKKEEWARRDWRLPAVLVLTAAWSGFVVWKSLHPLSSYAAFMGEILRGFADVPSLPGFSKAMLSHASVLASAAVFAAVVIMGGTVLVRIFRWGWMSGLERICVSGGLGWAALGTAFFGLALTGLFFPCVLMAFLGLLAVAGIWGQWKRASAGRRLSPSDFIDGRMLVFALLICAPLVVFFPLFLVPSLHIDFSWYHMAVPDHFLKLHRFVIEGASMQFLTFLTTETMYSIARILGQDELAPLIASIPFLLALVLGAAWVAREHDARAGAMSAGVALSAGWVAAMMGNGKNDLAGAGMCLFAFVAQARGQRGMAALFWGIACSVKINCIPFAGLAWLWHEAGRLRRSGKSWRPDLVWVLFAAVPFLPWILKSYILKGDPVWPVFSKYIPGSLWQGVAEEAKLISLSSGESVARRIIVGFEGIAVNYPVILGGLPIVVFCWKGIASGLRMVARLCVLGGSIFLLVIWPEPRFIIPLGLAWSFVFASSLSGLVRRMPRLHFGVVLGILCVVSWLSILNSIVGPGVEINSDSLRYWTGRIDLDDYLAARQSTRWKAQVGLREIGGLKSVLLIDNFGAYRWPGKVVTEGFFDMSPTWVFTREAEDVDRMLIRMKQKNIGHVVFNCIAELNVSATGSSYVAYEWNDRQVGLLRDFMKHHTEIVLHPVRCSTSIGGFYVYRILRNRRDSQASVHYLPGIKALLWKLYAPYSQLKDARAARANFDAYAARYPDVGIFRMMSALLSFLQEDWRRAYEDYSYVIRSGMAGDCIHILCAEAAVKIDKEEEALKCLRAAEDIYVGKSDWINKDKSFVLRRLAWKYVGDRMKRHKAYELAKEAVESDPDNSLARAALGMVLYELGRLEESRQVLEEMRARWPHDRKAEGIYAEYIRKIAESAAHRK